MTLDRDVLRDLLPLYLAGEASPATRALVEAEMASDPEIARLVQAAAGEDAHLAGALRTAHPPASTEKAALDATRRLLRRRSWLLAGAIFTSLLPFSVIFFGNGEVRFPVLESSPFGAAASGVCAVLLWIAYVRVNRRLSVTGL